MSGAEFFSNQAHINPYYHDESIDTSRACHEHDQIKQAFVSAGIEVIQVPAPSGCQDGVYTANWGLVRGSKVVLSRLPLARHAEEAYAQKILQDLGYETILVPDNLHFSGQGDSLPCGKYLLAGTGYRSDPAAQQFVADTLGLELIQLHAVPELNPDGHPAINSTSGWPDSFFYDIDLAISVIRDDLIAYCPEAFTPESQAIIENLPVDKIQVSLEEAQSGFACNLVSTGSTVIMSAQAPNLQSELHHRGLHTITPDITELKKGGGYIRCVSLTIAE